jgi:transcriptional regulator with XRE-family HTH domain
MKTFDYQKIKALRIQRGISQKELAGTIGVSYQTVSRWESGKAQPSDEYISSMAVALNAEIDDFYHIENRLVEFVYYIDRFQLR